MRTSASPGPGGSMVNSSTTPGCPGSRAMTPRATIDPLPLLPEDSATGLLLISYRGAAEFQLVRADSTPSRNRYISSQAAHPAAGRTRRQGLFILLETDDGEGSKGMMGQGAAGGGNGGMPMSTEEANDGIATGGQHLGHATDAGCRPVL